MIFLRVLGSVELTDSGGAELTTVLAQPKRFALLVYLAVSPGYHQRDTLLALFWPELDTRRARGSLNQAIGFLRKELGGSPESVIVSRGAAELGIDSSALCCDAASFRECVHAQRFGEAFDLYRGDLLPGFHAVPETEFEDWLGAMRAQLRTFAVRAAREVAQASEQACHYTTAVTSARRAVDLSGLDERAVRDLLTLLDRLGDRAGAMNAYEEFARRLDKELDAEPSAETLALVKQIRRRAEVQEDAIEPAQLGPGVELNGWRMIRELGRGGMATVHLALDVKHDRHVAIKELRPELATRVTSELFLREIQIMARLAHPHILPLIDSGARRGQPYLVAPYVAGESLRARLSREHQLPVDESLRLAMEIAQALDYAHRHGVIHCDIKPENILLADGHAVVADFGIARAISASGTPGGGGAKLSRAGVTVGTPAYMSPEQVMADSNVDGRSDIYSLGCVLYEMIAGQPFPGATVQSSGAPAASAKASWLENVRGAVPDGIEHVVLRALAKRPADRFATAGEMAEALRELLESGRSGGPGSAGQGGTAHSRRSRLGVRGWRRYALAGGVAFLILIGVAWTAATLSNRDARARRVGSDTDPNRIAVLYFEHPSDGGKLHVLADGLTEALIDQLSSVTRLRVVSRNGVAPFKGKSVSTDAIQRALGVGTIVSAAMLQSGDRLRVKIRLVDAASGKEIDSKTIEGGRANVLQIEEDLALQVSRLLQRLLGRAIEYAGGRPGTSSAAAWEAYQEAKENLAGVDPILGTGNVSAALQRLAAVDSELATVSAMDKNWSAPITLRGFIAHRRVLLTLNSDPSQIPKWLDVAEKDAAEALAVTPNDPNALELRGTVRYFEWAYRVGPSPAAKARLLAGAEADFRASVLVNPRQATAWNGLSYLLNIKSEFAGAWFAAQEAYDSDPYLPDIYKTVWRLFDNSVALNNRVEAEKWCTIGQQRWPDNFRYSECNLWIFALEGWKPRVDSIWRVYREFVDRSPRSMTQFNGLKGGMLVALGLIRAGLPDSARAVVGRSRGSPLIDPASELKLYEAEVRAQLGDKDAAVRLLSQFFAANPQWRQFAKLDQSWWWNGLRDYPPYRALIAGT